MAAISSQDSLQKDVLLTPWLTWKAGVAGLDPSKAQAAEQVEAVRPDGDGIKEVVGDKGYHSNQSLVDLEAVGVRTYISEPDRGRRNWTKQPGARDAVYRNRRRIRGGRAANACYGFVASVWNAPLPISMKPAACAACTCAGM